MLTYTKDRFIEEIRGKGLKITPQRLAIVDVLVEKGHLHPGANLVFMEARKKTKGLSLSTVYATLHEFSRLGLIKTMEFDQMENRFEGNLEEHVNLVCEKCGRIADYNLPVSPEPLDVIRKTGFMVIETRMEYYGYCADCLKERKGFRAHRKGRSQAA
jgi:Fur family peroxide stress response transcriptional regulator